MCNFNVRKLELETMKAAGIPIEKVYAISVATAIKGKTLPGNFNVYSFIECLLTTLANPDTMNYLDYRLIRKALSSAIRQYERISRNPEQEENISINPVQEETVANV